MGESATRVGVNIREKIGEARGEGRGDRAQIRPLPHRDAPLSVSYYDFVPTVLDVMGFAARDGMRGSSLLRR